jgi:feruloyl esterase
VAKLDAVSTAAVAACGGTELGFLLDPLQCRYDPTRDPATLCAGAAGNGVVGTNGNATTCVSYPEAVAINKIWFGQTTDGSVPDPGWDNGRGPWLGSRRHLWFGLTRGTMLGSLAGTAPFSIATDQVALELQDPTIAQPSFTNATGNGANGWRNLTYEGLAEAFAKGIALQPLFSNINTDNPDLRGLRRSGGKVLTYHGLADNLIMPQGSTNYFWRVVQRMGGLREVQKFNRLILIPALAHDGSFSRSGTFDPATGAMTSVSKVPLPQPVAGRDELFVALQDWVENGNAPRRIEVSSADGSVTMPLCIYPKQASYIGHGSVKAASSYVCESPGRRGGHGRHGDDDDDDNHYGRHDRPR